MKKYILPLFVLLFVLSSCGTLREMGSMEEPSVEFSKMSIQNITFDGVTLLFDFDVTNPNSRDINAEKYTYEFFINDRSFISGEETEPITVGKESTTQVQVPVSMRFSEVYEAFGSLVREDSISYQMATDVSFDMPIVGTRNVPVQASGNLPIPKIPRIELGDFEVKRLSLAGAEVEATFRVTNPNAFRIALTGASYVLDVNGSNWLDTTLDELIEISGNESRTITIPVRLNASQMGSALLDIMAGERDFSYKLRGTADVSADLEGFSDGETIPFDLEGEYRL